jgi:hypothetical protein
VLGLLPATDDLQQFWAFGQKAGGFRYLNRRKEL